MIHMQKDQEGPSITFWSLAIVSPKMINSQVKHIFLHGLRALREIIVVTKRVIFLYGIQPAI